MFGCRPYTGENTMLIPSLWPTERDVTCDHCKGEGDVMEDDETAAENAGIVIYQWVECDVCRGEGKLEVR